MKMSEITGLSDLDLKERIAADRETLQKLRFNHTIAGLESPFQLQQKRRDIARMLTELNARKNAKAEEQKS
ncbi:MAG: 50S ribosomal protein L29 [Crocinitomicaceae bacterium]|nr:50S ribosomal protein L29 [Crocinitomicaceae bacterium]